MNVNVTVTVTVTPVKARPNGSDVGLLLYLRGWRTGMWGPL